MIMESGKKQIYQQLNLKKIDSNNEVGHEDSNSISIDSSIEEDSTNSVSSMSSSDLVEDASSSTSSSSNGPLYELSELMAQLPIKRGLSKYYQGKSQSFTSLASVKNIEDLVKENIKGTNNRMKMKSCKSYGGGLDGGHKSYSPKAKATISKKSSVARGSFLSSLGKTSSFVSGCRSAMPVQKNFF